MKKVDLTLIHNQIKKQCSHELKTLEQHISDQERPKPKVMLRLWKVLAQTYGSMFVTQYGTAPTDSWERQLTGITPDQIADGLNRLSTRDSEYPPNAIEFRKLCLPQATSPDGHNSSAYLEFSDPKHPSYDIYRKDRLIEDEGEKKKRRKVGSDTLDNLKDMF